MTHSLALTFVAIAFIAATGCMSFDSPVIEKNAVPLQAPDPGKAIGITSRTAQAMHSDSNDSAQTRQLSPANARRLISPENPFADVEPLDRLWELYRAFEFRNVTHLAWYNLNSQPMCKYQVASVYLLAGAAAYLSEQNDARDLLLEAIRTDPQAVPDPQYFPADFCAYYAAIAAESHQHTNKE